MSRDIKNPSYTCRGPRTVRRNPGENRPPFENIVFTTNQHKAQVFPPNFNTKILTEISICSV